EPEGRISPEDTGIWNGEQVRAWQPITRFVEEHGSVPGIQLAHAGKKASTASPWNGGGTVMPENGGWSVVWSSSEESFAEGWLRPTALDRQGLDRVRSAFREGAARSLEAGFKLAEVHAAHGYLLHQFLSPLMNRRTDEYGGSLENRMRFPLEVIREVREVWPAELPLFVRISATDWAEGGWDVNQSITFARECKALGVDLIDCSSGGAVMGAKIEIGPGYQVPFASTIRSGADIPTGAVGLITEPHHAEEIVLEGKADLVHLAREMLRDPYWPRRAGKELGVTLDPPAQYGRAWV
ncbi:MAG TPA: NADH:flavin oxidoreductase/NADH oxidase, partial [Fimbriimonadaceae bacterium]|nr:NADH:flavin oxidoreductase/NADH oxidase [Fimbriimonadaceae bacterium]